MEKGTIVEIENLPYTVIAADAEGYTVRAISHNGIRMSMQYAEAKDIHPANKYNPIIDGMLNQHGVETKLEDNNFYAWESWTLNSELCGQWVNASSWTIQDCKLFLGY